MKTRANFAPTIAPLSDDTVPNGTWKPECAIEVDSLHVYYGALHALKSVTLNIRAGQVTALIGPSGCGKSTFLRTLNRMNDLTEARTEGTVQVLGEEIYRSGLDAVELRRRVGMVFQQPNVFPRSIFENVVYGLRRQGVRNRRALMHAAEASLRRAALWDEVKDRLTHSALALSGGQQQRLCIARALALAPEILLMDEPAAALDPLAAAKIEELILRLKGDHTIVVVTHNMEQALRISDETAFFFAGELVEMAATDKVFNSPSRARTADYVAGRFG